MPLQPGALLCMRHHQRRPAEHLVVELAALHLLVAAHDRHDVRSGLDPRAVDNGLARVGCCHNEVGARYRGPGAVDGLCLKAELTACPLRKDRAVLRIGTVDLNAPEPAHLFHRQQVRPRLSARAEQTQRCRISTGHQASAQCAGAGDADELKVTVVQQRNRFEAFDAEHHDQPAVGAAGPARELFPPGHAIDRALADDIRGKAQRRVTAVQECAFHRLEAVGEARLGERHMCLRARAAQRPSGVLGAVGILERTEASADIEDLLHVVIAEQQHWSRSLTARPYRLTARNAQPQLSLITVRVCERNSR